MRLPRLTQICLIGVSGILCCLTGCQSTSDYRSANKARLENNARALIEREARLNDVSKSFAVYTLPYEKGPVGFQVRFVDHLSEEAIEQILQSGTVSNPDWINPNFTFVLNGVPLGLESWEFPKIGNPLTGWLREAPVPDWVFTYNPELLPIYEKTRSGNSADLYAFANALQEISNTLHPYLTPLMVQWILKAADAGSAEAALEASILLEEGIGIVPDPERARTYLDQAVQLGNPTAMNNIAWIIASNRTASEKQLRKALQFARSALEIEWDTASADTLALVEARLGLWEQAIEQLNRIHDYYESTYTRAGILQIPPAEQHLFNYNQLLIEAYARQTIPEWIFL